jgi:membrane protein YqaA with SNARE-associated domain
VAAPALAQGPASSQAHTTSSAGLRSTVVGGLPLTGLDLIALAAGALALSSVGFALRRAPAAKRA